MRVTSDRQTLILAGETPPRRSGGAIGRQLVGDQPDIEDADFLDGGQGGQQVTIISARLDAVVTQGLYHAPPAGSDSVDVATLGQNGATPLSSMTRTYATMPALPPTVHQAYIVTNRGASANAASAYARTRDLSDRTPLIDTYA